MRTGALPAASVVVRRSGDHHRHARLCVRRTSWPDRSVTESPPNEEIRNRTFVSAQTKWNALTTMHSRIGTVGVNYLNHEEYLK